MTPAELSDEELFPLFEAARWAPSCYNAQPWRFIYAKRNTHHWQPMFDLLVDFNKSWCVHAAVLGLTIAKTHFEHNGSFSKTHAYDAGAAWENLALEGVRRGLVVHGMGGFNATMAKKVLNIPEGFEVIAMFAIGKPGPVEALPQELQEREAPSDRKSLKEIIFEGSFE
jgi:nitroreductase